MKRMEVETMAICLTRLREAKGLSKYRLAKLTGVSETYIYRLEAGEVKNPRRDTLLSLAKGMGVTVAELAGEAPVAPAGTWQLVETSLKAYIPVYAEVSAGEGIEAIDYVACTRLKPAPETLRAYRVKGLCLEPDIMEWDTIIVDTSLDPRDGDLVVCIIDGEASVKKYHDDGVTKWLKNNHGTYFPEDVYLHGVVVEFNRKRR